MVQLKIKNLKLKIQYVICDIDVTVQLTMFRQKRIKLLVIFNRSTSISIYICKRILWSLTTFKWICFFFFSILAIDFVLYIYYKTKWDHFYSCFLILVSIKWESFSNLKFYKTLNEQIKIQIEKKSSTKNTQMDTDKSYVDKVLWSNWFFHRWIELNWIT